ncbi:MAG: hypothetical protein JNL32_03085 [Candidatus Kapabacteria bacterium]|nr:hypothetical protein [Candidatus Kapabacteria bacterium]
MKNDSTPDDATAMCSIKATPTNYTVPPSPANGISPHSTLLSSLLRKRHRTTHFTTTRSMPERALHFQRTGVAVGL